jgi:hypothetical protein
MLHFMRIWCNSEESGKENCYYLKLNGYYWLK